MKHGRYFALVGRSSAIQNGNYTFLRGFQYKTEDYPPEIIDIVANQRHEDGKPFAQFYDEDLSASRKPEMTGV